VKNAEVFRVVRARCLAFISSRSPCRLGGDARYWRAPMLVGEMEGVAGALFGGPRHRRRVSFSGVGPSRCSWSTASWTGLHCIAAAVACDRTGLACNCRCLGFTQGAGKVCLGSQRQPGGQHWVAERVPAL
jgi:hypothetical protein